MIDRVARLVRRAPAVRPAVIEGIGDALRSVYPEDQEGDSAMQRAIEKLDQLAAVPPRTTTNT